jgi:hypothetical protein
MSGGHFDYKQYDINYIYDEIEHIIRNNGDVSEDEYGCTGYLYSDETIEEFKKAVEYLKLASIYAQRIDWLVSGDDGEDTFHKRLIEDKKKELLE